VVTAPARRELVRWMRSRGLTERRCLAIVDDATHEAVALVPEHTIGGDHLIRILDGSARSGASPR